MADTLVRDWLADGKVLNPTEEHSFACTIAENHELIHGIFSVLDDRSKHVEFLESICNQLFTFYRSREVELRRFSLQYLPAMIGVYLCSLAQGEKKAVKCVEVFLLGIYNLEVVDTTGHGHAYSFRLPCIAQPSIYHAPMSLASASLTENALSKLEKGDSTIIAIGPFSHVEALNAQNRAQLMTVLMNVFNRNLSYMSKPSLLALCKLCSRLTRQGFCKQGSSHRASYCSDSHIGNPFPRPMPRIPLTHLFVLEILHGVYYSMFNGLGAVGLQALDDVHARASHDMMAEVVLVTNAIKDSLHTNPSGHPSEGPMGISISVSPTTSMTAFSKSIITNASFRTKKLPDDIPIQMNKEAEAAAADALKSLATISEEADDSEKSQHNAAVKTKDKEKTMAPLMGMISKISEKTKMVGKKTTSDDSQQQQQASTGNKLNKLGSASSLIGMGSSGGLSSSSDGKKKEGELPVSASKGGRRDGDGERKTQNGDSTTVKELSRTEVVIIKNQPRTQLVVDAIEMKVINNGTAAACRISSRASGNRRDVDEDEEDDDDARGSLSSNRSSMEDEYEEEKEKEVLAVAADSGRKRDANKISMSRTEMHTLV